MERDTILNLLQCGPVGVARWNVQRRTLAEPPKLERACLCGADLCGADLHGLRLFRGNLHGAQLREASLEGANLSEADFSGADLTRACLASAKLFRCNLNHAVLCEANLSDAYLGEAEMEGADLRGANLRGATGLCLTQLRKARLDDRTLLPPAVAAEFAVLSGERKQSFPPTLRTSLEG